MTENDEERERDGLWWHEKSHDAYGSVQVVDLFVAVSVHARRRRLGRVAQSAKESNKVFSYSMSEPNIAGHSDRSDSEMASGYLRLLM